MTDRPILFSGPMVRAVLNGAKTQTRRVVKGVPSWEHYGRDIMDWGLSGIHQGDFGELAGTDRWFLDVQTDVDDNSRREIRCPYGAPGDRLWVRETWGMNHYAYERSAIPKTRPANLEDRYLAYAATEDDCEIQQELRWRPSIHMPRWMSRLTLEVTEVRVERLQDISEADSLAEGIIRENVILDAHYHGGVHTEVTGDRHWPSADTPEDHQGHEFASDAYAELWGAINGPGSWAANPFVWAISFHRVDAA